MCFFALILEFHRRVRVQFGLFVGQAMLPVLPILVRKLCVCLKGWPRQFVESPDES